MTNGDAIRSLIGCAILTAFLGLILFEIERWKMTQPQPQQTDIQPHCWAVKSPGDRYEQSPMMAVMWRTPNADGMSPLGVLQSTVKRMQYEQTTPLGNDQNAKALVKVLEAVAILEGRETVTAEGFPIIE
jgi:hypothetical protein